MNKILCCLLLATAVTTTFAQGGTNSPYSQFGLGEIAPDGVGFNRAMNGVGIGMHQGNQVNPLNPASYASIDSLTMIFDMGLSGQLTNFNENGTKVNARNGSFEYAVGSFRVLKNLGMSFGIMPVTNVGYKYTSSDYLADTHTTIGETYEGDGGLHKIFVGAGMRVLKPLSVGFNIAYLWGGYNRSVLTSGSSSINSLSKVYSADVNNYTLDFGIQYDQNIGMHDLLTVGVTYGLGHKLGADAECMIVNTNATTSKADTTEFAIKDALRLPHTFGVGASYTHGMNWIAAADIQYQKWGSVDIPDYYGGQYLLRSGMLKNRYNANVGFDWTPRYNSRRLLDRIHYRFGAGYATPYYKIKGHDGPRQISVSAGFGIPIQNSYNNRSILNVSAQWVNNSAEGLIKENTFRINVGLTFNERWFAKWKVE